MCDTWKLTHWGLVTHICVSKLTIIVSDNGLSPGWRQAIIWINVEILLMWPLGTNFSEILIKIQIFPFKKLHLKISSEKRRPFCLGLNVLIHCQSQQDIHQVTISDNAEWDYDKPTCTMHMHWLHQYTGINSSTRLLLSYTITKSEVTPYCCLRD